MKRKYTVLGAGILLLAFLAWFGAVTGPAGVVLDLPLLLGGQVSKYVVYLVMGLAELLLIVPVIVYMAIRGISLKAMLGNRTNPAQNLLALALGILMVPAFSGIDTIFVVLFRLLGAQPMDTSMMEPGDLGQLLAGMVAIGATAGVVEEPLFRGVVQRGLGSSLDRRKATIWTALFFSFVHMDVVGAFERFLIGVIFGYMAWRAGSILPGILAHAAFNSTALGLSLLTTKTLPGWEGFFPALSPELNGIATWMLISVPFIALAVFVYWRFACVTPASAAWDTKPYVLPGEVKGTHYVPWALAGIAVLAGTALMALIMWLPLSEMMPDMAQFFK